MPVINDQELKQKWETPVYPQALSRLCDGEIDLWLVDLDRDSASISSFLELLSDDERARAEKFVFARDRERFTTCRATLRKVLGGYLGIAPEKIAFSVRYYGKPYLSTDCGLRFNVAHSKGIAVIAVSMNREVGVDIEFVNREFDVFSVASSAFSSVEVSQLRLLPLHLQAETFFAGWTRKEAFLKAMGDGLSSSEELQNAISFISDGDASYRSHHNGRATDWTLTSIEVGDNYKAALAAEGQMARVRNLRSNGN